MMRHVGIDFGTTNSVIAVLEANGTPRSLVLDSEDVFRTVLCFWSEEGRATRSAAGPAALRAYLEDPLESRLIMSMKSYLAQRSFTETRIFGRRFSLPDLVALFLRALTEAAGISPGDVRVVAGRPVRFAGELADDAFGDARLRQSFAAAGFGEIAVALEPEGAGWRFASGLTRPANVLVGDFGGGTSDFSVLRFVPGAPAQALGHAGVGIAGDVFDYRIIDNVISPLLGKDDLYRIMDKDMPIPAGYFSSFARWHQLSLMRSPRILRDIAEVARTAEHPERLQALMAIIRDEQGFALYQAVSAVKAALSRQETATLRFAHAGLDIAQEVRRSAFEAWIAADLARMGRAIDDALVHAGLEARDIDHVFLTGGTSFVPAVRRLFEARFGVARVAAGGEFVSVAEGLALIGAQACGDQGPPTQPDDTS